MSNIYTSVKLQNVYNSNGVEGLPSYTFTDDDNTGIWAPAADTIAFSTNGAERMRVASTVDIATTARVDDIDTLNATTLLLGKATATRVEIGKAGVSTEVRGNLDVVGNLTVSGTTTSIDSENVLVADNYICLNKGYVTPTAQSGGMVVNYLPTGTESAVGGNFVAGVASSSNPTVVTTDALKFTANDIVQISGSNNNDGIYEVLLHAASILTIRGIGLVPTVESFTHNDFNADTVVAGVITKVSVSVMRAGTDGIWETGAGSETGIVYSKLGSATDHGALTGLGDDDHTQYQLLLGRSGGQDIIGGTAASDTLTLESTSNGTKGTIDLKDPTRVNDVDTLTSTALLLGKATASKVEIGKVGAITEVKGVLTVDNGSIILNFDDKLIAVATSTTTPDIYNSSSTLAGTFSFRAFDQNNVTFWRSGAGTYPLGGSTYGGSVSTTVSGVAQLGEWVQIIFNNNIRIGRIDMASLDPATNRVPNSWVLAGSEDGVNWFSLRDETNALISTTLTSFTFTTRTVSYIRLIVRETNVSTFHTTAAMTMINVYNRTGVLETGDLLVNGILSSGGITVTPATSPTTPATSPTTPDTYNASTSLPGTFPWQAFDQSDAAFWRSGAGTYTFGSGAYEGAVSTTVDGVSQFGEWVQVELNNTIKTGRIDMSAPSTTRVPLSWVLAGSLNGTTWFSLRDETNTLITTVLKSFNITKTEVKYVRLVVRGTNSSPTSSTAHMWQITIYKTSGDVNIGGTLDMTNGKIENVLDPTSAQDAATKSYVDEFVEVIPTDGPAITLNTEVTSIQTDILSYAMPNFNGIYPQVKRKTIVLNRPPKMTALNNGVVNGSVFASTAIGIDLYVGGSFTSADSVPDTLRIAKWNGTTWSALSTGVNGTIYALASIGTDLYVGGSFTSAGGVNVSNIAKWNGTTWSALSTGVNGDVFALASIGTDLYVGGSASGALNTLHTAKWNGATWSALSTGVNGTIFALASIGTDLYVGGLFTTAIGVPNTLRIAKWNGTTWSALSSGVNNTVRALSSIGTDLYVGGDFTTASGVTNTLRIAKWNGTTWSALSSGVNNTVRALSSIGTDLYVGGSFISADGVPDTLRIAKWDGTGWYALGTGTTDVVTSLASIGTDLYVGGDFTSADGVTVNGITKWGAADDPVTITSTDKPFTIQNGEALSLISVPTFGTGSYKWVQV